MLSEPVLESAEVREIIRRALAEDGVFNDITTAALVPPEQRGGGVLLVKEDGVIAGLPVAAAVFAEVDAAIALTPLVEEGARVRAGQEIARLDGRYATLLRGERVALNLLQRLSGIATMAARAADAVAGLPVRVVDTRKTTPGLRALEKQAVRAGGGHNHRAGLDDAILVKENHAALAGGVGAAASRAQAGGDGLAVEVECATLAEVGEALAAGAGRILLDNMGLDDLCAAVERARGRAEVEASGGVTLANVRSIAETGVDFVSVGALTHSAPALDLSLGLEPL